MLSAANAYLASRGLPGDALVSHFEYPSRTSAGIAYVTVQDVKLGKQLSMLHLTLWQDGLLDHEPWVTPSVSKPRLLAYTRHADLHNFTGISIPTPPHVRIPPRPDFSALKAFGKDDAWVEAIPPAAANFAPALRNWHFYMLRDGSYTPGVLDVWMRLANDELITQGALAYVADSFPYNLHGYISVPEVKPVTQTDEPPAREPGIVTDEKVHMPRSRFWFPTLSLNVEAKKAMPHEGVEWVAVRVVSQQFKDGRFDLDAQVRDENGELIALGHQVALVVSMDRNTAGRTPAKAAL